MMNNIKIIWSNKIPNKVGNYLTRNRVGNISNTQITEKDLIIQKEDETWLGGVSYSQPYVEDFNE